MCDHCGARDFVRRANKVSDALIEAGRHQDAAVAFHTGDGIRITGHVPRKAQEYLWDIEVELNIDEPRPEVWGDRKGKKMAKKPKAAKMPPCAPACKGCLHEAEDAEPCFECVDGSKYDVGPQETTPKDDHETDEAKVALGEGVKALKDFVAGDIERMRRMGADPETGEVPSTDRDVAVPAIAGLVQRIVEENAPRALAAYLETKVPASFSVTCKLSPDPVRAESVFIEVSGKLAVGVKGASGFVSIDDQQTRLPGA